MTDGTKLLVCVKRIDFTSFVVERESPSSVQNRRERWDCAVSGKTLCFNQFPILHTHTKQIFVCCAHKCVSLTDSGGDAEGGRS